MPVSKSNNEPAKHRIAVYGSLRKGEYNYRPEMGAALATGWIKGADLYSLGAFPCIVKIDDNTHAVKVEVYDMDDKVFIPIERMELGAGYTRQTVTVHHHQMLDCDNDTCELPEHQPIEAEAYFYPRKMDWFGPRIESGDWAKR